MVEVWESQPMNYSSLHLGFGKSNPSMSPPLIMLRPSSTSSACHCWSCPPAWKSRPSRALSGVTDFEEDKYGATAALYLCYHAGMLGRSPKEHRRCWPRILRGRNCSVLELTICLDGRNLYTVWKVANWLVSTPLSPRWCVNAPAWIRIPRASHFHLLLFCCHACFFPTTHTPSLSAARCHLFGTLLQTDFSIN